MFNVSVHELLNDHNSPRDVRVHRCGSEELCIVTETRAGRIN